MLELLALVIKIITKHKSYLGKAFCVFSKAHIFFKG